MMSPPAASRAALPPLGDDEAPEWVVTEQLVWIVPKPDPKQTQQDSLGAKGMGEIVRGRETDLRGVRWLRVLHKGIVAWMLIDGKAIGRNRDLLVPRQAPAKKSDADSPKRGSPRAADSSPTGSATDAAAPAAAAAIPQSAPTAGQPRGARLLLGSPRSPRQDEALPPAAEGEFSMMAAVAETASSEVCAASSASTPAQSPLRVPAKPPAAGRGTGTKKAVKQKPLGSQLPRIVRSQRCPGVTSLPSKAASKKAEARTEKKRLPLLYILVIGGEADAVVSSWHGIELEAPLHLEVATYEWPGHGVREDEPKAASLEELSEDAFETFREAMSTGSFIMCGDSIGALVMTVVCSRAERELGVKPRAVFAIDHGPPHLEIFSEYGAMLLERDPMRWFYIWNPSLERLLRQGRISEAALSRWVADMSISRETLPVGIYTFPCRVNVVIALQSASFPYRDAPPEDASWITERRRCTRTGKGHPFELSEFDAWSEWSADVRIFELQGSHEDVHRTQVFLNLLWAEADRVL